MKKVLAILVCICLIASTAAMAFAANTDKTLRFNDDGKFTIAHITDIQDTYPLNKTIKTYIQEMLVTINPDLVVLGGDNTVGPYETKAEAIKELCDLFVESETYFTLVFGNHDYQQGMTDDELFELYLTYGGEYCLAYDAVPELHGTGTHNLPVMSSDGSKVAFNLFMFDSGSYTTDNGEPDLGYDCVHEDQIEWYKNTAEALKETNGGETVYAMAFQHIIVQEAVEKTFIKSLVNLGDAGMTFENANYTYLPKLGNIEDGWLLEHPCPGYHNYGQLDAMAEQGDVLAIFSGHDHLNNFTVDCKGIKVTNSAGCTYHSYGDTSNRGARIIVLDENDTTKYETYTYTLAEAALKDGSAIASQGDITIAGAKLGVAKAKFLSVFVKILRVIFFMFK